MLELGESSAKLHRECGNFAGGRRELDWIFGVRGNAAEIVRAAVEAGHPRERTRFFEDSSEAAEFLAGFVAPEDLILIKGSRGVKMEKILEAIDRSHPRLAPAATDDAAPAAPVHKGRG
jgi:UDP-N-acetylmuramoyl-tripeptide--D-alanyl-D-alanine ligase